MELNNRQKTRLLSLGLDSDHPAATPDENEQRGDLLCDVLRGSLPAQNAESGDSSSIPGMGRPAFRTIVGASLQELLRNPTTDVGILRRIKDYAKALGTTAGSEVEKDVFLAIYFAAIAAALAHHAERITEHADADMAMFFSYYASGEWIPANLRALFQNATHAYPEAKGD